MWKDWNIMSSVIWITGISGSGKTTLANAVAKYFIKNNKKILRLDGNQLRAILGAEEKTEKNFSREARLKIALRYSALCKLCVDQNITTIISTISMFREVHSWNRKNLKNYLEVFLKIPIEEAKKRDSKNLYKKYKNKELSNIAGLDLKVDEPENPHLILEFYKEPSLDNCVLKVINEYNKVICQTLS